MQRICKLFSTAVENIVSNAKNALKHGTTRRNISQKVPRWPNGLSRECRSITWSRPQRQCRSRRSPSGDIGFARTMGGAHETGRRQSGPRRAARKPGALSHQPREQPRTSALHRLLAPSHRRRNPPLRADGGGRRTDFSKRCVSVGAAAPMRKYSLPARSLLATR